MNSVDYASAHVEEKTVKTTAVPSWDASESGGAVEIMRDTDSSFGANLIFSLIITAFIYSLPIAIYRYMIRREPVSARQGRKIAILYGLGSFALMSFILFLANGRSSAGYSIILWGSLNYFMLTSPQSSEGDAKTGGPVEVAESSTLGTKIPSASIQAIPDSANAGKETLQNCRPGTDEQFKGNQGTREGSVAPRESEVVVVPDRLFCHACGKQIDPNSQFCRYCGVKVGS